MSSYEGRHDKLSMPYAERKKLVDSFYGVMWDNFTKEEERAMYVRAKAMGAADVEDAD